MPGRKPGAAFWNCVSHSRPARARLRQHGVTYRSAPARASPSAHRETLICFLKTAGFQPSPSPQLGSRDSKPAKGAAVRPYCWPPPCSGRKQWLPEGEQRFPRTAVSCGSSRRAPLFASFRVGRKLGAGHPRGLSAASLARCALTFEHLPLLPSRRQSVLAKLGIKKTRPRLGHRKTSGYEKEPRKGSASGDRVEKRGQVRNQEQWPQALPPCPTQTHHLTVPGAVRAKSQRTITVAPVYLGDCPPNPEHKWSTHLQKHAPPASARKVIRHCR